MFSFFSTHEAKSKAIELCEELAKKLPPKMIDEKRKILSVNKISSILENIFQDALKFKKEKGMGIIKRSVFINTFRWTLQEKGYPKDFIDLATEGLMVELAEIKNKANPTNK